MAEDAVISVNQTSRNGRCALVSLIAACVLVVTFCIPISGLPASFCLFKRVTGLPCPGCGLTRSVICLSHGEVGHAMRYHPFGIVAYLVILGAALSAFLSQAQHSRLAGVLQDRRLGFVFTIVFVAYALFRIMGVATGHIQNIW